MFTPCHAEDVLLALFMALKQQQHILGLKHVFKIWLAARGWLQDGEIAEGHVEER
jgi:hypothetical protein